MVDLARGRGRARIQHDQKSPLLGHRRMKERVNLPGDAGTEASRRVASAEEEIRRRVHLWKCSNPNKSQQVLGSSSGIQLVESLPD